jgi:hypothetical protein
MKNEVFWIPLIVSLFGEADWVSLKANRPSTDEAISPIDKRNFLPIFFEFWQASLFPSFKFIPCEKREDILDWIWTGGKFSADDQGR